MSEFDGLMEVRLGANDMMQKDDLVTLANYAKKNDLLDTPGWKICRRHARRAKKLQWMLNQTHRQSKSYAP